MKGLELVTIELKEDRCRNRRLGAVGGVAALPLTASRARCGRAWRRILVTPLDFVQTSCAAIQRLGRQAAQKANAEIPTH